MIYTEGIGVTKAIIEASNLFKWQFYYTCYLFSVNYFHMEEKRS